MVVFTLLGTFLFKYMEMDLLQVIGTLVLTIFGLSLLRAIFKYFLRPGKDIRKYGEWAVITGATDGIGLALAEAFAKKGFNLVLISRTQSRLDDVAKTITAANKEKNVEVRTLVVDYGKFSLGSAAYTKVQQELADLDIGILVNNVGFSKAPPLFFTEIADEDVDGMLKINIQSCVWMTKLVLPGMKERKRGAIVNIGSGAATMSSPLMATYTATKAFMESFSSVLNVEAPEGVHVQCQIPLFVATKLAKMRKSLFVPTPKDYAKYSIRAIGHDAVISPFWGHALQLWIGTKIPTFIANWGIMKMHLGLRKRGLAKIARQQKENKQD